MLPRAGSTLTPLLQGVRKHAPGTRPLGGHKGVLRMTHTPKRALRGLGWETKPTLDQFLGHFNVWIFFLYIFY